MIRVRNKVSCLIWLIVTSTLSGCGLLGKRQSPAQIIPSPKNWEVAITRLKVIDAEEDRSLFGLLPLSNGDEPYIIMLGFRSTFGRSGSTQIVPNSFEDNLVTEPLKAGQQRYIPTDSGVLRFAEVTSRELIGVAIIAMESDRTPRPIIGEMITTAEQRMKDAAAWSIESQGAEAFRTPSIIDELHRSIQDAASALQQPQTTGKIFEELVFSGGDRDEVVGINSLIFFNNPPQPAITYPQYRASYFTDVWPKETQSNVLVFENSALQARYEAELRVREY